MNKKLQLLLANIALNNSPYGTEWYSGPKRFEDSLIARGVKLPHNLYYKYKLSIENRNKVCYNIVNV